MHEHDRSSSPIVSFIEQAASYSLPYVAFRAVPGRGSMSAAPLVPRRPGDLRGDNSSVAGRVSQS